MALVATAQRTTPHMKEVSETEEVSLCLPAKKAQLLTQKTMLIIALLYFFPRLFLASITTSQLVALPSGYKGKVTP